MYETELNDTELRISEYASRTDEFETRLNIVIRQQNEMRVQDTLHNLNFNYFFIFFC